MRTNVDITVHSAAELTAKLHLSHIPQQGIVTVVNVGLDFSVRGYEHPDGDEYSHPLRPEQFAARLRELADSIDAQSASLRAQRAGQEKLTAGLGQVAAEVLAS